MSNTFTTRHRPTRREIMRALVELNEASGAFRDAAMTDPPRAVMPVLGRLVPIARLGFKATFGTRRRLVWWQRSRRR